MTNWSPKKKRSIAKRMIRSGRTNDQIKEHLRINAGSGISSEDLAALRAEIGKSGPNKRKVNKKKNGKITKEDIMVLQGQDLDPHFKELLSTVKEGMITQGIHTLELDQYGRVKASQLQDVHVRV